MVASDDGVRIILVERRRWRLVGTTKTRQNRFPDDAGASHFALLVVLLKVAGWLLSGVGLHTYADPHPRLRPLACRRTVQRWQRRLAVDGTRIQGANLGSYAHEDHHGSPDPRMGHTACAPRIRARELVRDGQNCRSARL